MLRIETAERRSGQPAWPGMPLWMSSLLAARGVETAEEARRFLHPSLDQLLPPEKLPDLTKAADLLRAARDRGEKAAIYGDYDVDGVSASAILWEAFEAFGLRCESYIPDRHTEGYGLNKSAVEALSGRCRVLVTVDCGITSLEEVALAKEKGMTVIVTDHHRHGERLPAADAVISPLLGEYPFPYLCGAGVAWKLAMALLRDGALPLMELAALATVADMVPLTGENRVIVALGLKKLSATARPGLRALMNRAGIRGEVSADQVGFQIAPRMNACGRLDSARIALRMLLTRDAGEAEILALKMENLNQQRKDQEAAVLSAAQDQVNAMDLVETKAIVVSGEGWNSGVVGLAAGRIAEKYAYPTVALAREGDLCVGSARSAGEVDIHAALTCCADLFERFGGHRQAAGLTMKAEHLPEFTRRLSDAVAMQTGGMPPQSVIRCDGEMTLEEVTEDAVAWLDRLAPYGIGNPAPRFLCDGAIPLSMRSVGAEGRHLKCTFRQGNALRDGIFFGGSEFAGQTEGAFRVVMTPVVNEFRGKTTAECRIHALQLLPESLPPDPDREMIALFSDQTGGEKSEPIREAELDALMRGGQGTLLLCRCRETALRMLRRFPAADFALEKAADPRAYHTVLLYGKSACAPFRHVVLCDGDLGEGEAWRQRGCPGARIHALPRTEALQSLLAEAFVDVEALRRCYLKLRGGLPRDLANAAEMFSLSRGKSAFALAVLSQIQLIAYSDEPFRIALLPMVKRSPEESPLFRLAYRATEEKYGLHSV